MARSWRDVRSRAANLDETKIAEHRERMLGEVRAARLAEVRERHGLTQTQVADRMGVSQARVSAIETGNLPAAEVGTIGRYVAALGGHLEVIANIDGERLSLT